MSETLSFKDKMDFWKSRNQLELKDEPVEGKTFDEGKLIEVNFEKRKEEILQLLLNNKYDVSQDFINIADRENAIQGTQIVSYLSTIEKNGLGGDLRLEPFVLDEAKKPNLFTFSEFPFEDNSAFSSFWNISFNIFNISYFSTSIRFLTKLTNAFKQVFKCDNFNGDPKINQGKNDAISLISSILNVVDIKYLLSILPTSDDKNKICAAISEYVALMSSNLLLLTERLLMPTFPGGLYIDHMVRVYGEEYYSSSGKHYNGMYAKYAAKILSKGLNKPGYGEFIERLHDHFNASLNNIRPLVNTLTNDQKMLIFRDIKNGTRFACFKIFLTLYHVLQYNYKFTGFNRLAEKLRFSLTKIKSMRRGGVPAYFPEPKAPTFGRFESKESKKFKQETYEEALDIKRVYDSNAIPAIKDYYLYMYDESPSCESFSHYIYQHLGPLANADSKNTTNIFTIFGELIKINWNDNNHNIIDSITVNMPKIFSDLNSPFKVCFTNFTYFVQFIHMIEYSELLKIINSKKLNYFPVITSDTCQFYYKDDDKYYNYDDNKNKVEEVRCISLSNVNIPLTSDDDALPIENDKPTYYNYGYNVADEFSPFLEKFTGGSLRSIIFCVLLFITILLVICLLVKHIVDIIVSKRSVIFQTDTI